MVDISEIRTQPEIQRVATMMRDAFLRSRPKVLLPGEWHLPFLQPDEEWLPESTATKVCVARCARVSTMTHEGKRDIDADLELYYRLLSGGHMSPFEHVAQCLPEATPSGNLVGFQQLRKAIPGETKSTFPMPDPEFWARYTADLGAEDTAEALSGQKTLGTGARQLQDQMG